MQKTRFLIIALVLLVVPTVAFAFEVKTGSSVHIGKDEVVHGTLYAAGSNITVDGTVAGDIFCAGQTVTINGKVEGDVICGGQALDIGGEVGGSIRVAGGSVIIRASAARNIQTLGASIILNEGAVAGWDMLIAGETTEIRGRVGRDLHGASKNVIISGQIGNNVILTLDDTIKPETRGVDFSVDQTPGKLTVEDSAVIGGNVSYRAAHDADIAEGAGISGEITRETPREKPLENRLSMLWAWGRLYSVFAALIIGLVSVSLWREQTEKLTDRMLSNIGAAIGWGAVVMFLTPFICVLLLLTVIGIPLAFILLAVWIILLYVSKIFVGILVGRTIFTKMRPERESTDKPQESNLLWPMVIGILLSWIIFSIPGIGWLLSLIAVWWGLGGMWLYFRKK